MSRIKVVILIVASIISFGASAIVVAQELERGNTVMDRARPDFDAAGVPLGVFRAFPAVGLDYVYDDNIFATENDEEDDRILIIRPELIVLADWSRADLELGADLAAARYDDFDTEDYDDWRVWSELDVELGRGLLSAEVRHEDLTEERTSPDDDPDNDAEPTEFTVDIWSLGYRNRFNRLDLRARVGQDDKDFDDTPQIGGGVANNDDRDRTESELELQFGYELSSAFLPFIRIGLTDVEYDQDIDDQGFERSNDGYELVAGTEIDLSGKLFGEVFVGYMDRDYDDDRYESIEDPSFGAELTWNATGLTTVNVKASRMIEATTIENASGITDTGFAAGVDHELLRNVLLSFDISFNEEDFEGIDRTDDIFKTKLEGIYMLNRYLQLHLGYEMHNRDTSPGDTGVREFDKNSVYFGIRGQI